MNILPRFSHEDDFGNNISLPMEVLAGMGAGGSQVVFTNPLVIT